MHCTVCAVLATAPQLQSPRLLYYSGSRPYLISYPVIPRQCQQTARSHLNNEPRCAVHHTHDLDQRADRGGSNNCTATPLSKTMSSSGHYIHWLSRQTAPGHIGLALHYAASALLQARYLLQRCELATYQCRNSITPSCCQHVAHTCNLAGLVTNDAAHSCAPQSGHDHTVARSCVHHRL
jgi:hypothetical protein